MLLKKLYSLGDTRAAIDRANNRNINALKMVRSDVSVVDWGKTSIKVKERNSASPDPYPGKKDVGHVFRHVEGTATAGKSIYFDHNTAGAVTREILNSTNGQTALASLDAEVKALYDNSPTSFTIAITGVFYGSNDDGVTWQRITQAKCQLQKLGDLLWVHTSYPTALAGTGISYLAASANARRVAMGYDF